MITLKILKKDHTLDSKKGSPQGFNKNDQTRDFKISSHMGFLIRFSLSIILHSPELLNMMQLKASI